MSLHISPPFITKAALVTTLNTTGYAVLPPASAFELLGCTAQDAADWLPSWNDLTPDAYLKDGGHYRRRRHSCFVVNHLEVQQTPHRAHWQPLEYNALHGGMQRMFEPMSAYVAQSPA
jgi:hypothetical protein